MKTLSTLLLSLFAFTLSAQVANDVAIDSTWFVGKNRGGVRYGAIPFPDLDQSYLIGARVKNVGLDTQTNVALNINFLLIDTTVLVSSIAPDSSFSFEFEYTNLLTSSPYQCNYSTWSDSNQIGSPNSNDNLASFEFLVTGYIWARYSQDCIGISSTPMSTVFNSADYPNTAEGLIAANLYQFGDSWNPFTGGLEILLGPGTEIGTEVFCYFVDSSDFMDGPPFTPITNYAWLYVDNSAIQLGKLQSSYFETPNNASVYLMSEIYTNNHNSDIVILDDTTFTQVPEASVIYNFQDSSYNFSPNALAVRLIMYPEGLDEYTIPGVEVFPNPTNGPILLTNENHNELEIHVADISGKQIAQFATKSDVEFDLQEFGKGVYLVLIESDQGTMSRRIVVE